MKKLKGKFVGGLINLLIQWLIEHIEPGITTEEDSITLYVTIHLDGIDDVFDTAVALHGEDDDESEVA